MIVATPDEGRRVGAVSAAAEPVRIFSILSGAILVYVAGIAAALPDDAPYEPLAPEQMAAFKRDLLVAARPLLFSPDPA